MEFIAEIRRRHFVDDESISSIVRSLKNSYPTVRKALKTQSEPAYRRSSQPMPKLGYASESAGAGPEPSPDCRSVKGARHLEKEKQQGEPASWPNSPSHRQQVLAVNQGILTP